MYKGVYYDGFTHPGVGVHPFRLNATDLCCEFDKVAVDRRQVLQVHGLPHQLLPHKPCEADGEGGACAESDAEELS